MDVERESIAYDCDSSLERCGEYPDSPSEGQSDTGLKLAGDLRRDSYLDIMNRVYDPEGISPTLHTGAGGGMVPKIDVTDLN